MTDAPKSAPGVGEAEQFCGEGWVFWDDDGEEYSPDHPDAMGKDGVEGLRRSTPQEDLLWSAWQAALSRPQPVRKAVAWRRALDDGLGFIYTDDRMKVATWIEEGLPHEALFDSPLGDQPTGWKLVPVDPTEPMQNEGVNVASDEFGYVDEGQINRVWAAMLAAAPYHGAFRADALHPTEREAAAARLERLAGELDGPSRRMPLDAVVAVYADSEIDKALHLAADLRLIIGKTHD